MAEAERAAKASPRTDWAGSIRFRLAVLYSVLLFGLATIVVGGIYAGLARSLEDQDVSRTDAVVALFRDRDGQDMIGTIEFERTDPLALFEREVNEQALDQLRTYAFGALGILFIGSLGVGWFVSGLVLRPVERIRTVASDIQHTDLSRRINLDGPDDELKHLADTFDEMLGRIDDAFQSQREFIHEASHELRNPLAVIRTNIDVALADPDADAEELRSVSEVVGRSAERMTTLVDDLLLYARHGERTTREEDFDLVEIVGNLAEEFEAPAEARGLVLTLNFSDQTLPVCGDTPAVRRAVANLLANAIRLAPSGTSVTVACARHDGWNTITIADEGPGIPPEDHQRVFQRFWRGDKQKAREQGRSGLGLTIVRRVMEAHGGRVDLSSNADDGSTFMLWFPESQNQV